MTKGLVVPAGGGQHLKESSGQVVSMKLFGRETGQSVTLNGKACKLEDLKKDVKAKLTVRKGDGKAEVLKVEATTR